MRVLLSVIVHDCLLGFSGGREKVDGVPVIAAECDGPDLAAAGAAGAAGPGAGAPWPVAPGDGRGGEACRQWLQCRPPPGAADQGGPQEVVSGLVCVSVCASLMCWSVCSLSASWCSRLRRTTRSSEWACLSVCLLCCSVCLSALLMCWCVCSLSASWYSRSRRTARSSVWVCLCVSLSVLR